MKDIVIIGNGGLAKEVAFLLDCINKEENTWNLLGFIAKEEGDIGKRNGKYPVYQCDEWLISSDKSIHVALGIGNPALNSEMILKLQNNANICFPNLIHPNVIGDWDQMSIGEGNVICASNIFTVDITIGSFNIFNPACTVGHDTTINNFNVFNHSSNISGGVNMGSRNLIGTGVQVLQYLTIGNDNKIGAGAVVTESIIEKGTYVGIPARKIR